jgi:hypothetical protein
VIVNEGWGQLPAIRPERVLAAERSNITILSFICCPLREGRLIVDDNFRQSLCRRRGLFFYMRYIINLSEESDHLLRHFCDSGKISPTEGISPVEFLSAFVEDQLDELFARRERRKTGRKKNVQNAVQSAKEHAQAWSEASVATHNAVKALEKLVVETIANPKTARPPKSSKSFTCVNPGKRD